MVRVGFVTRAGGPARAATVRIGLGTRFAVTRATLRRKGLSLKSGRPRKRGKAGLLIRPINSATVELRVYPVARGAVTWALLEGVALLPDPKRVEPRIYRAGGYFLVVGPGGRTASLDSGPADFVADFALPLLTHQRSLLTAGDPELRVGSGGGGGPAGPPGHEPLDPVPPPPPQNPPLPR